MSVRAVRVSEAPDPISGSRERILDAGLELIARYGVAGMSLQLLADHVGLHKSTLFHHFADKRALVDEVSRRFMTELARRVEPLLSAERPELEQLLVFVEELDAYFADHPRTALFVMRELLGPNDRIHGDAQSPETAAFFGGLSSWLVRARRAGVVRPLSVPQAIVNLIGVALFYPALIDQVGVQLFGAPFGDPRSAEARRKRRRELREMLERSLAP